MTVRTEFLNNTVEIGNVHLPIIFSSKCPYCQEFVSRDFSKDFSYTHGINEIAEIEFWHEGKEVACNYIWSERVVLKVGVFAVSPAIYNGWGPPSNKIKVIKALRETFNISLLDAKKWSEKIPRQIDKKLAKCLEEAGAIIEWR